MSEDAIGCVGVILLILLFGAVGGFSSWMDGGAFWCSSILWGMALGTLVSVLLIGGGGP